MSEFNLNLPEPTPTLSTGYAMPQRSEREARYAEVRRLCHVAHVSMKCDRLDVALSALERATEILRGMP